MALSAVTARGSAVDTVNDASIAMSPSANLTVGKFVVVVCATKNIQTTDGASTNHSTVADNAGGNTWTKHAEYTESAGVAADGSCVSVWTCRVATQIGTGNTITLTTSGNISEKIITCFEVSCDADNTVSLAQVGIGQTAIAASVSSLASREYLLVGAAAAEGSDNAKTPDADYTEQFDLRSQNLSTAITTHVQTRIATLTSDTVTSTAWTNTDPIALLLAFYEERIRAIPIAALALVGLSVGVGFGGPYIGQLAVQGQAPTAVISGAVTISPPAGSITISGQTSTLAYTVDLAKGTLTLSSVAPAPLADKPIPMPAGAVVLAGQVTTIAGATTIALPAGSLLQTGQSVGVGFAGPDFGRLFYTGYGPTLSVTSGTTLSPSEGVLTLHGLSPAGLVDQPISVPAGALTLAGQYVGALFGSPTTGALTWTGYAPTMSGAVAIAPAAGSLTFTSVAPVVARSIDVPAGTIALIGQSPAGLIDRTIAVPNGLLALTGRAPTGLADKTIGPASGTLTWSASATTISLQTAIPVGALTLTGAAPTISGQEVVSIPVGRVFYTGTVPLSGAAITLATPAGALLVTGRSQVVFVQVLTTIPAGALTLQGQTPSLSGTQTIATPAGALTLTGRASSVFADKLIAVPPGSLVLQGTASTTASSVALPVGACTFTGRQPFVGISIVIATTHLTDTYQPTTAVVGTYTSSIAVSGAVVTRTDVIGTVEQ